MKNKILIVLSFMFFIFPTSKVEAMLPSEILTRQECPSIELAEAKEDGSLVKVECYDTYQAAKDIMNQTENDNLVIIETGIIIDAKYAVVDYDISYPSEDTQYRYIDVYKKSSGTTTNGYLRGGTPDEAAMLDYDYNTKRVKIKVAGLTGWIDKDYRGYGSNGYDIVPLIWVTTPQSYTVTDNTLVHNFPGNVYGKGGTSYTIDKKPIMLEAGTYYSYDGHYFYSNMKSLLDDYKNGNYNQAVNKDTPYYNYYQYLSFRTKTSYSSENINQYISLRTSDKESKMLNTGEYFINTQNNYGINAILMMAIGMNESGRGTSDIAKTKNNLFGLNAVDATPGESANYFLSVENCIDEYGYVWLSYGYIQPGDYRFRGANLGNKSQGLNYKYASDPFWAEKAASYYYDLDSMFSFQDYNSYQLAVLNNDYSNTVYAKKTPGGENVSSSYYQYKVKESAIVILEELEGTEVNGNKIWYKIQSDPTLDTNQNYIGDSKSNPRIIYDFNTSIAYVPAAYFTKVNTVTVSDDQSNTNPDNVSGEEVIESAPNPNPNPAPTPTPTPTPTPPPAKKVSAIVEEANYKYGNGNIYGIKPGTSVKTIKKNLTNTGGVITVTDANGNTKENGNIGTGDKVNITSGTTEVLTVLIYGDINGDGNISAVDYVKIKNHIMGSSTLNNVYTKVADVNNDGNISAVDYVNVKNYIMGVDNVIKN